jgi:hypothetical protein
MWDYWPHTRSGTRVTVKGERPVALTARLGCAKLAQNR